MEKFNEYNCGQLLQLISEAHLKWEYQRSSDIDYLRQFASKHFFAVGENEAISSIHIKREHEKYKQAASHLLDISPLLEQILIRWCVENDQQNAMITDEMKRDREQRFHHAVEKLQQQECAVMVFGDTGAGKSSLINMILEQDLMRTSAIKTTFTVCEIRYSERQKYSIAETERSAFIEQPYPSSVHDTMITNDRRQLDYVRERYECPIDLLKGGIIIADSPGLNENETLTNLVQAYMRDCLVFICVINRGITDSLQNLLNELKSAGRTSAKSIFFVITHLDDKEPNDRERALNQIHCELGQLYEEYDPINHCCMLNPDKAFKTYKNHHFYEQAHYEFLQKFIPFLANALKIKLEYLFHDLYDIFERLDTAVHVKYNQSIMESHQCYAISQRILLKKKHFDLAKDRIKAKTKPLSNNFDQDVVEKMLRKCDNHQFKDELEQEIVPLKLPAQDRVEITIGELKFTRKDKKDTDWRAHLTKGEARSVFKRYKFSLLLAKHILTEDPAEVPATTTTSTKKYMVNSVDLCKIYCQFHLSQVIQKKMALILDEKTKEITQEIWKICQEDLQAIDEEIMDAYQQLTDVRNGRGDTQKLQRQRTTLLHRMTDSGRSMDFFMRTKLWLVTHKFEIPLHVEALTDWFKGLTYKEIMENENNFKLRVTQYFHRRIVEKLKKQKENLEAEMIRAVKEENKIVVDTARSASPNRLGDNQETVDSSTIVDSVLGVFEQVYTEIEQLAQTVQTGADARKWEEICLNYMFQLEPIKHLLNNFRAVHLLTWPLISNQVICEMGKPLFISEDGRRTYEGHLMIGAEPLIPVHIHQLTQDYNVMDIHSQCQTLAITNNHPHILHCYGVYHHDSSLFVVTEPIHSKLEQLLSDAVRGSLKNDERIQMALELAQCIQYLHREKLLCTSIHPNSILITADQRIKLNVVGEEEDFRYLSPQRLLRRRDIDPFYDNIYAFGLVLYRLFHTDVNEIALFRSGRWLLPPNEVIQGLDVPKDRYLDYVHQNHSTMTFEMPKMNYTINNTIKSLIRACCSFEVQQRPDMNVIISILNTEKLYATNQIPPPLQNDQIKHYGLLSIDGGGSRGIIAARIIETLETRIGKPLWTVFDLVGGCSTGGMLALSCIQRRTRADELAALYRRLSSRIFPFSRVLPTTQYPHEPLEEELKNHFEEMKLATTDGSPKLFVVTKRATDTQPYLLRNYDVTSTDSNSFHQGCSGWLCRDAARATTAAPTYFKPFVCDEMEYSDGGVGFNNPVQLVFEEALSLSTTEIRPSNSTQKLYHFPISYIVSIGTGMMPALPQGTISQRFGLGGMLRVKNATDVLIEQATECENAHLAMKVACERYGIPYFRFNTPLPERVRMDLGDELNLNRLSALTDEYMNTWEVKRNMDNLCLLIMDRHD